MCRIGCKSFDFLQPAFFKHRIRVQKKKPLRPISQGDLCSDTKLLSTAPGCGHKLQPCVLDKSFGSIDGTTIRNNDRNACQ